MRANGFTMIEILITLLIFSIILGIAFVSYSDFVRRGRRIDAINTLLGMSLAEERYRATHSTYGTHPQIWGTVTTTPEGYYNLGVNNVTTIGYELSALAIGDQANDKAGGTSCATLTLTSLNGVITKTPTACWPS